MEKTETPKLTTEHIHLWVISLKNTKLLENIDLENFFPSDELAKANSFAFPNLQLNYLFRRFALRVILSRYIDIEPNKINISYGNFHKPYLSNSDLHFNITDSGDIAFIAVARNDSIGVDVELIKPIEDILEIAKTIFSNIEFDEFLQISPEEQLLAFYNLWTRKEAFIKAIGHGLFFPLKEVNVSFLSSEQPQISFVDQHSVGSDVKWFLDGGIFNHLSSKYVFSLVSATSSKNIQLLYFNQETREEIIWR